MSDLPTGWTEARLSQLGSWAGGGTPSKAKPEFWANGTIPWVSPKDMKVDIIRDTADHITDAAVSASATNVVASGSVLAVTRSGILRRTFPVAVTSTAVAVNQDLKALTPAAGVNPHYVAWSLRKDEQSILHECSKDGTTVDSIDFQALLRRVIPLPPTAEQERIVAAIEEELSRLEAGAAALKRVRRSLRRLRAAALDRLLEDREGTDWPQLPLGEVLVAGRYGTSTKCTVDGSGLPVLRIPNVQSGVIDLSDLKYAVDTEVDVSKAMANPGDILVIRTNGSRSLIGRPALIHVLPRPMAFASYLIQLRVNPAVASPKYVAAALEAPRMRVAIEHLAATSAGQYNISLGKLRSLRIPLPGLAEQSDALVELEHQLALQEGVERVLTTSTRRAARLRAAVLKAALTGKLVPQDPSDEPASTLLERIAAKQPSGKRKAGPKRRSVAA